MSTVQEIERAVQTLSSEELSVFRAWFDEYVAAAWDKQIERDAAAGRLDRFAAEAIEDFRNGRCTDL